MGIAQASVVDSDEKLAERVTFIHERIGTAGDRRAIYRGPRDLCRRARQRPAARAAGLGAAVRQSGRRRPADRHREGQARPRLPGAPRHRARAGQGSGARSWRRASRHMAKRIYRTLDLDGYARIDFRLAADGTPYFLEANPNPEIAKSEEFAQPRCTTGSNIPTCCTASWRSACSAPRGPWRGLTKPRAWTR